MKYFTCVLEIEDGHNAKEIMDAIEKTPGVSFTAGSWSHVMRERDDLKIELDRIKLTSP